MKNFIYKIQIMLLATIMVMATTPNVLAQGNSKNKIQSFESQNGISQQAELTDDNSYPWINYQGLTNLKLAKQAWIKDNEKSYRAMLPSSFTEADLTFAQSMEVLNVINDAKPISYGNQITNSLVETNSKHIGKISGDISATYSFTATSRITRISTCNSSTNFDTYLKVYNQNNGELVEIASNDDACGLNAEITIPTTIGETYYAVVNGYNNTTGNVGVEIFAAVTPTSNPSFGQPCPLRLVLVLDRSASVDYYGGTSAVISGVNSFVNGLLNTGTQVAIIDFATSANLVFGFQEVTTSFQSSVSAYLTGTYDPPSGGSTNWAAAFNEVNTLNSGGTVADLVVFLTDGLPNQPSGTALNDAITAANAVKGQFTRIFMLGVGSSIGSSIANLQAVSGPNQVNPPTIPFVDADYGLEADFSTVASSLANLSTAFLTDYYLDDDLDGYGAGPATNACDAPGGNYVTIDGDCDDNDATVYPGAPDLCDGIANDCSNPNWPIPDVLDTDDDGDGLSECAGDCDDTNPDIYPGAGEICDGFDNDCSGALDDADCDGVEDLCDVCPGGNDNIDADTDGYPDCATEPSVYDPSWECDNKGKKITLCHVDEYGNRFELCVSKNAAAGHLGHGDFLGPCISCDVTKMESSTRTEELHVEAYPVPATDVLMIEVSSALETDAAVLIVDYLGRTIHSSSLQLINGTRIVEVDVSDFAAGVYMLSIESTNTSETIKVIIQ